MPRGADRGEGAPRKAAIFFGGDLGEGGQKRRLRAKKQGFFVRKTPVFGDPYGNTSGEGAVLLFSGF